MRCLHCGKRLSLLRQLASRQFCCEAHRVQYLQDQESLGLARLIDARRRSSQRAPRRPAPRPALSVPGSQPPVLEKFFSVPPRSQTFGVPIFRSGDPVIGALGPALPAVEVAARGCAVPRAGVRPPVLTAGGNSPIAPAGQMFAPSFSVGVRLPAGAVHAPLGVSAGLAWRDLLSIQPQAAPAQANQSAGAAPVPAEVETNGPPVFPETGPASCCTLPTVTEGMMQSPAPPVELQLPDPRPVEFAVTQTVPDSVPRRAPGGEPPAAAAPAPPPANVVSRLVTGIQPVPAAAQWRGIQAEPRLSLPLPPLHPVSTVAGDNKPRLGALAAPERAPAVAGNPVTGQITHLTMTPPLRKPHSTIRRRHAVTRTPVLPVRLSPRDKAARPAQLAAEWIPPAAFLLPPADPAFAAPPILRMESAPVAVRWEPLGETAGTPAMAADPSPVPPAAPPEIRMPAGPLRSPAGGLLSVENRWPVLSVSPAARPTPEPAYPEPAPVPVATSEAAITPVVPDGGAMKAPPSLLGDEPAPAAETCRLIPLAVDKIVPLDAAGSPHGSFDPLRPSAKPLVRAPNLEPVADPPPVPAMRGRRESGPPLWRMGLAPVIGQWRGLPAGIRWSALLIPLVALLMIHSGREPATLAAAQPQGLSTTLAARWDGFKESIASRAAIALTDDFRSGLGDWQGAGNWAKTWSYDKAGFLCPGDLALYKPSVPLADYEMEFSGQIEKRALGWVYRAADTRNYYAAKLVVAGSGPLPKAELVRYTVIDGRKSRSTVTPLPFPVRNGKMYRVRVNVRGQNFTTYVDGHLVDFFRDPRLSRGGVGFFTGRGERARLRWVSVMHQYDFLGRLCALLAPYNLDSPSRSWNP